jgi:outer membrane protein OmpA-like peptidoglycan-associated protein
MKRFLLLLITLASMAVQAQPTRTLSADEIVEQLAAPPRTRSLGQRAFRLEPRKLDFQIGFDFDSARIRSDSVPQLEEIVRAMNAERLASIRFRIEGHTDGVGTAVYNEALSDRRAKAVVEFLQSRGVFTSRLEAEGKGMRELADPANPQAAVNRRVRIVTID